MSAVADGAPPATRDGRTALGSAVRRCGLDRPVVPVLVTVGLLCAPPDTTGPGGHSGVTPADLGSGVVVVWCAIELLRGRARQRAGRRLPRRALTPRAALVLGAPTAAFAVTTVASADPAASLPGFVRYLQLFVLVPGAVLLALRDARDARLLCGAVVLLALVEGGIGVVQAATGTGASYQGEEVRAVGTFGALDVMGMATAVAYGLVIALACGLVPPAGAPRWLRPCALGSAAALVLPLALSYSRGAWLATVPACLLLLALRGIRTTVCALAAVTAAGVLLVGGFGVATQELAQRVGSITEVSASPDRSVTDRYTLWSAATDIWQQAPATGVGPKGFPEHRDTHAALELSSGSDAAGAGVPFQREPLLSPHNMYLLVLSEQGLVGTVALLGAWGALLVCALRRLGAARNLGAASGVRDCGAAATALLVWQSVDFLYGDIGGPSTVLTALVLGLGTWWALSPAAEEHAAGRPAGGGRAV